MTCNILSIDGGGIRGLIELKQLQELETRLGKKLCNHFDIITGTSTGGLIAVMLSLGYSTEDCIKLYTEHGDKIFKKSCLRFGLFRSTYDDTYFNNLLKSYVGDSKLKHITKCKLIVPSYNATKVDKKLFKSYDEKDADYSLFEVMRSTSAAPTYFDTISIKGDNYIDGGMVINNPAMIAHVEALKMGYNKINIISFSSGTKESTISRRTLNGGKIALIDDLINILLTEQAQTTDYTLDQIYKYHRDILNKPIGIYIRCNSIIDKSSGSIDDVSKKNMNNMIYDGVKSAEINKLLIGAFAINTLKNED
jgi:patatin-like phospholipase/acyl hydrolase